MTTAELTIGDPISSEPEVSREKLEEIFADICEHPLYDHELNGCLNCGICTATCPSAHYFDYSPREIVQLLWTENLEGIYDAMQEKIWGLRTVLHLCGALPVQQFTRRTGQHIARDLNQTRSAVSKRCAAALFPGHA